jgi:hypothetical protein
MRLENRTAVVKEPREDWPGDYTADQVGRKSAATFCRSVRLIGSAKAVVNRPLKPELGERIPQGSACPATHHSSLLPSSELFCCAYTQCCYCARMCAVLRIAILAHQDALRVA